MKFSAVRQAVYDVCICIGLALSLFALVFYSEDALEAARGGVTVCLEVIVPSLFPYFVLGQLVVGLGLGEKLGNLLTPVMRPLFGVSGNCAAALALGFLGGYPVGAKTLAELYDAGHCSKEEAEQALCFCNNSGPAFIIGMAGVGVFHSAKLGFALYAIHILAAVLVGILLRPKRESLGSGRACAPAALRRQPFSRVFAGAVKNALAAVLNICGFVLLFTVILRLLTCIRFFALVTAAFSGLGLEAGILSCLFSGFMELSTGILSLAEYTDSFVPSFVSAAFILGWAGISVQFQTVSVTAERQLSCRKGVWGKLIHGCLSALLALPAAKWLGPTYLSAAGSFPAGPIPGRGVLMIALPAAAAFTVLLLLVWARHMCPPGRSTKKSRKTHKSLI